MPNHILSLRWARAPVANAHLNSIVERSNPIIHEIREHEISPHRPILIIDSDRPIEPNPVLEFIDVFAGRIQADFFGTGGVSHEHLYGIILHFLCSAVERAPMILSKPCLPDSAYDVSSIDFTARVSGLFSHPSTLVLAQIPLSVP